MEAAVIYGVGKGMRIAYKNGNVSEDELFSTYKKYKCEADAFSAYGYRNWELVKELKATRNPQLKEKIERILIGRRSGRSLYANQDEINLKKLEALKKDACGFGLRSVIKYMRKLVKRDKNPEAQLVLLMLETEFANLSAKKCHGKTRHLIYDRKTSLLLRMAGLLKEAGCKHGVGDATGKKANFIVFAYLPDGTQLTWHDNDYHVYCLYPNIDDVWDGQVCMNMQKILNYIHSRYLL